MTNTFYWCRQLQTRVKNTLLVLSHAKTFEYNKCYMKGHSYMIINYEMTGI